MGQPFLIDPTAGLIYTFDFSDEVPAGVSVTAIAIVAPAPLTTSGKTDDLPNKQTRVLISGAIHGQTYQVEATATLSNGETVPLSATLRGWNS
ncbi:MAG TPA: hypothetical protein PLX85_00275 [Dehalococcoidia bacterium]|nr:hypothetical protein [Dehalococcoidia bacterium]